MNKLLTMLLLFVFAMTGPELRAEAPAADRIQVSVGGVFVSSDADPILLNGRTQVPIRFIAERLGYEVKWAEASREVIISKDEKKLIFQVGSDIAKRDGKEVKVDNEVFIQSGRTYLPLRFVGESFGEAVSYDQATRTAIIGPVPLTTFSNADQSLQGFIDLTGKEVVKPKYKFIDRVSDTLYRAVDKDTGKGALINAKGEALTEFQYDDIQGFEEGYSLVYIEDTGKYGVIDESGKEIVVPKYESLFSYKEGYFAFVDGDRAGFVDVNGKEIVIENAAAVEPFSDSLAVFQDKNEKDYKFGIIDKNFKLVLEPKYRIIVPFQEGFASYAVRENNKMKWGFLNREGKPVIEAKYDFVQMFHQGRAIVKQGAKYGLIDESGKEIVSPKYEMVIEFGDHLYAVNLGGWLHHGVVGGKWGLMDGNGKLLTEVKYDAMLPDIYGDKGYFSVCRFEGEFSEEHWGILNAQGKEVIPLQYERLEALQEGLAVFTVGSKDNPVPKYGAIDGKGNVVIEPNFDYLSSFNNGVAIYGVSKQLPSGEIVTKYGFVNKKGQKITEANYAELRAF